MGEHDLVPGAWPRLSRSGYARLVRMAESRLVGYESAAEDVVSRAFIRWRMTSAEKRSVARIEQLIKWESESWRRSNHRSRAREARYMSDPTSAGTGTSPDPAIDFRSLLGVLEPTATRRSIAISEFDRSVLLELSKGQPMSAIARQLNSSRYKIGRSRQKWQLVLRLALHTDERSELFGQPHRSPVCCSREQQSPQH